MLQFCVIVVVIDVTDFHLQEEWRYRRRRRHRWAKRRMQASHEMWSRGHDTFNDQTHPSLPAQTLPACDNFPPPTHSPTLPLPWGHKVTSFLLHLIYVLVHGSQCRSVSFRLPCVFILFFFFIKKSSNVDFGFFCSALFKFAGILYCSRLTDSCYSSLKPCRWNNFLNMFNIVMVDW